MKNMYVKRATVLSFVMLFLSGITLFGQKSWYVLNNVADNDNEDIYGWVNLDNWTEDPAAAIFSNPDFAIPQKGDNVIIKAGKEITIPADFEIDINTLTVDGILYVESGVEDVEIAELRGEGRIYLSSQTFLEGVEDMEHFVSPADGGGTVVFDGNENITFNFDDSYELFNLDLNFESSQNILQLESDLTINGRLNITKGGLQFSSPNNIDLTVYESIIIEEDGGIFVSDDHEAYHNIYNFGDFYNNGGEVKLSNAPQYAAADNGAVRLTFKGATNNDFVVNGTTKLYRLFIDKGTDDFYTLSVTSNNEDNFKLMGPYEGTVGIEPDETSLDGWEKLPLVIRKGTLKLGANINIDNLGYLRSGTEPNEFFIPTGAGLWINGAQVNSGVGNNQQTGKEDGTGISLAGKLRISAGSFTTPAGSSGITYNALEEYPASLSVEGGEMKLTQLRSADNNGYLNFNQTGGILDFHAKAGAVHTSPVFSLPNSEQLFEMSGGEMIFRVANNRREESHGIYITSSDGNFNVTGGTVEIRTPFDEDFQVLSLAPFYNLIISEGDGTESVVFREHWSFQDELTILNNLEIGENTTVNAGDFALSVGGNLTIDGNFLFNNGALTMNRSGNSIIANNSGTLELNKLNVFKSSTEHRVALEGSSEYSIADLTLTRGDLDLVDKTVNVTGDILLFNGSILNSDGGSINLSGTGTAELYSSRGKELAFGTIDVNKSVELKSHVLATEINFGGNHIVDLDVYNLELAVADYIDNGSWGDSRMFRTAGRASNGGLTLPISLEGSYDDDLVQIFPVGTEAGYTPAEVFARNNHTTSGRITAKPVDEPHPTMTNDTYVLHHYWRMIPSELDGVVENGDFRYRFTYYDDIHVDDFPSPGPNTPPEGIEFFENEWNEYGQDVKDGDDVLNFPFNSNLMLDYTFGVVEGGRGHSVLTPPRTLYSRKTGNYHDNSTWSEDDHDGDAIHHRHDPPTSADYLIIHEDHTVTIDANNARASQVEINGTLKVNNGSTGHEINTIKGSGRIIFEQNGGYAINNTIDGDYSEFIDSPDAIIEYTGTGGYRIAEASRIPYYPNLVISGNTTNVKYSRNNASLIVNEYLIINDAPLQIDNFWGGRVEIGGDLIVNNNDFVLSGQGTLNTYIDGNIVFSGDGTLRSVNNGGENILYLKGGIELGNGNIDFNSNNRKNHLVFTGDSPVEVNHSGSGVADFYRMTIDKPEDVKVHFTAPFSLNADAGGASNEKPLLLSSGIAHLDNSEIDLTLNSGGGDFQIPSTSKLIIDNGATVKASGSNSSLFLDGALVVDNDGEFLWQGDGNNHVKYSASGNASVWLGEDAKFYVGSQFYRNSEGGVVSFTQAASSADVQIATIDAPLSNLSVFEVLNNGSEFIQAEEGSAIHILRGQTNATQPALRYNPTTVDVANGSKFILGNGITESLSIFANQPIGGLEITDNTSVLVRTAPLVLNGDLLIGEIAELDANNLNVTLYGNMEVNGNYLPGNNTTLFESESEQTVVGTVAFNNLSKLNGLGKLSLGEEANVVVDGNLRLVKGSIDTYGDDLQVKGNVTTALETTIGGVLMNGETEVQILEGGGELGRLTIDNPFGVVVASQPDPVLINEKLVLANGVFDIGRNQLVLTENAVIEDEIGGSDFSETNMIQTFLSFTDAGIRKYLPFELFLHLIVNIRIC
ncbi:hypothetical protein QA597_11575 [Marinilabiliaceae bacterium ANBcel2]|nr:hypothetical protein [Marinilabiliaceae bacterium ANBcel2]